MAACARAQAGLASGGGASGGASPPAACRWSVLLAALPGGPARGPLRNSMLSTLLQDSRGAAERRGHWAQRSWAVRVSAAAARIADGKRVTCNCCERAWGRKRDGRGMLRWLAKMGAQARTAQLHRHCSHRTTTSCSWQEKLQCLQSARARCCCGLVRPPWPCWASGSRHPPLQQPIRTSSSSSSGPTRSQRAAAAAARRRRPRGCRLPKAR